MTTTHPAQPGSFDTDGEGDGDGYIDRLLDNEFGAVDLGGLGEASSRVERGTTDMTTSSPAVDMTRTPSHSRPGWLARVAGMATSLLILLVGLVVAPSAAHAAGACYLTANAPYKHVRSTGQKQVFGKGSIYCDGGRVAIAAEVRVAKWNASDGIWYWVNTSQTVTENSSTKANLAYGWLCDNYGWGSSGTGYYQTYTRGSWMYYGGSSVLSTTWKTSGYRYLSC